MAEEKTSNNELFEIFIPLLNEGVPVLRPTKGCKLQDNLYQVMPTVNYDPEVEEWKFLPNTVVRCKLEIKDHRSILVAVDEVSS